MHSYGCKPRLVVFSAAEFENKHVLHCALSVYIDISSVLFSISLSDSIVGVQLWGAHLWCCAPEALKSTAPCAAPCPLLFHYD